MTSIFAGIHIKNKVDFLPITDIDFEKDVLYLKKEISKSLEYDAENIEVVYMGNILNDEEKLSKILQNGATVHCFTKTTKYNPYVPATDNENIISTAQKLFNVVAHIQVSVNSRMNILNKILNEYPEFRRNLGAQALIRDSVLFNLLYQPEVIQNIAQHYPIIIEAAPFIVDTIKKELTRSTSSTNFSEQATDSTNSSEEENSLGASSSSNATSDPTTGRQSENAQMRQFIQQQLQAALSQFTGSHNSLANIAERNAERTVSDGSESVSTSASGDRISSEEFRHQLQRVLNALQQRGTNNGDRSDQDRANVIATSSIPSIQEVDEMDTSEVNIFNENESGEIPNSYQSHEYAEQLRTMAQMGFINYEENLTYLNLTNGNIENAVNLIVGSMN